MTPLQSFLRQTFYIVASEYPPHGIGSGDPFTAFDDACDAYAALMSDGLASAVIEVCVTAGTSKDVTAAARLVIAARLARRRVDLPEWLEAA